MTLRSLSIDFYESQKEEFQRMRWNQVNRVEEQKQNFSKYENFMTQSNGKEISKK